MVKNGQIGWKSSKMVKKWSKLFNFSVWVTRQHFRLSISSYFGWLWQIQIQIQLQIQNLRRAGMSMGNAAWGPQGREGRSPAGPKGSKLACPGPSVVPSVGPVVRPVVCPVVRLEHILASRKYKKYNEKIKFKERILNFKYFFIYISPICVWFGLAKEM